MTLHLLQRTRMREVGYALQSLAGRTPYTVQRHFDERTFASIEADAGRWRPDLVYCDHLSMIEYGRRLRIPIVYDAHNVEHALLRRFAARAAWPARLVAAVEWRRVRAYERDACRRSRLVFAVSDVDARALRALAGEAVRIRTAPIAVDAAAAIAVKAPVVSAALLFVGGLHWPPNVDAVQFFLGDIWPAIRRARPDARFTIVGRDDHPQAARWRQLPGVTVTGWVADISSHVAASRALVVPMRAGSGMRVKILEAMARGLPVVSTSAGAEGIEAASGEHLLVADDPASFAEAALRVLADEALAAALAGAARALVLERYDVSAVAPLVLEAVVAAARDRAPAG